MLKGSKGHERDTADCDNCIQERKNSSQTNKLEFWIANLHKKIMTITLTITSKGVQLQQRDNGCKKNFQEVKGWL